MPAVLEQRERTKVSSVPSFEVVADHPRNCDLLLQAIPNCRLRSAISASKHVIDAKTGEPRIPADQARHLGQLPPTPGMHLSVNPADLSYEITDPLNDNEDLCERLRQGINRTNAARITGKLRGVPTQRGKLDEHRMKTLCREIIWLLDADDVKMVRGSKPSIEEVDELPGKYLLNPGSQVRTSQPQFECDYQAWIDRLTQAGG